jgi:hypothetical protein
MLRNVGHRARSYFGSEEFVDKKIVSPIDFSLGNFLKAIPKCWKGNKLSSCLVCKSYIVDCEQPDWWNSPT